MYDSEIIEDFEKQISKFAGSKYGVAVSSNTNGIFLCFELLKLKGEVKEGDIIEVPNRTYMSVPMTVLNVGLKTKMIDKEWSGTYQLKPTIIWDAAVRFTKDMYVKDSLYVISFQYRKGLSIGRGGMILTNSKEDYEILKKMRFNGRTDGITQAEDVYTIRGWNMYMTPEQAARGLTLFTVFINDKRDKGIDIAGSKDYPDLSKQEIFKC